MTEPMPSDTTRTKHIVLVVCGALVAVALGLGLWAIIARPGTTGQKQVEIEPAQPTQATTLPAPPASIATGSAAATTAAGAQGNGGQGGTSGPGGATTPGGGTGPAATPRVALVAYRLRGMLCVANEDGSAVRSVLKSAEGPYMLSPDGTTIALVENGSLSLISVANGARKIIGPAEASSPVWEPGSQRVMFVRTQASGAGLPEVWRVGRDGSAAAALQPGSEAAVSPDGRVVVVRPPDAGYTTREEAMHVAVSVGGGAFARIELTGQPTAVSVSSDRIFVGLVGDGGVASVVSLAIDGSGTPRSVLGTPEGSTGVVWGKLAVSPDGARLAAAATGDDGFSRVTVVPCAGGKGTSVTPRRDGELYAWTMTGDALFLFEGNMYQGEQSSLVRVKPDGSDRTVIMSGAQ